jgi:16S rRNA (cytosine1402-N4)-methyltransferase
MEGAYHVPVLCEVAVEALLRDPGWIYVDGTFGGGGHAARICDRLSTTGRCIGFDCDEDAIREASQHPERFHGRLTLVHANFRDMRRELNARGIDTVGGVLLDLGVSSHQLDDPSRGFSFRESAELDMRMDRRQPLSALDVVNTYGEAALADVLFRFGEERNARRVARAIVSSRPLAATGDLRAVVERAVGQHQLVKSLARVFQALRIEVNRELENLGAALADAVALLVPGGRLVVISYHSLEDRMVKQFFRMHSARFERSGHKLIPDRQLFPALRTVTPHPVESGAGERDRNPRARSAKMRVAEKCADGENDGHA